MRFSFMPILEKPKHEMFAQALAKGMTATSAWSHCGFDKGLDASGDTNAYHLSAMPMIKQRVKEIMAEALQESKIDIRRVLLEMERIGLSDVGDILNDDWSMKPLSQWSFAARAAVKSVKFDRYGNPEIKFWDKNTALANIGRHFGMFNDSMALTGANGGPVETIGTTMTPQEAANLYALSLGK